MAVPFQHLTRHTAIGLKAVYNAGYASRQRRAGVRNAIAQCIAHAEFHRHIRLTGHLLNRLHERHDESVEIRPCQVFQMTSRHDARFERITNHRQIMIHRLPARHSQLGENMVVRTAYQNSGLLHADVVHEAEVFLLRPNPGRNLRELQSKLHAFLNRLPIPVAVYEELRLTNDAIRAGELRHHLIDIHDLFHCIRFTGLLSVTERRVGNPDFLRHVVRASPEVERYLRYFCILEELPHQIGFIHVLQLIAVRFLLQQIGLLTQLNLTHYFSPQRGMCHAAAPYSF